MQVENSADGLYTKTLQTVLQAIISSVAVIYTLGFIAANSYYISFGVTEYQLVQVQYIATGLIFLFFHIGIASMIAIVVSAIGKLDNYFWLIIGLLIWFFLGAALYIRNEAISATAAMGINAGLITFLGYQIWFFGRQKRFSFVSDWITLHRISQQSWLLLMSFGFILLICISAISWGRYYWPLVSTTLGGGRPNEAYIIFDDQSVYNIPFIPMQTMTVSQQIPILFETSDSYVVLTKLSPKSTIAIKISKSIVQSVVYAPPDYLGKKKPLPTLTPLPISSVTPISELLITSTSFPLIQPTNTPVIDRVPNPTQTPRVKATFTP